MENIEYKNTEPLVSIVMPFFNISSLIRSTAETVLNQTYSNIEFIAINDGGIDSSLDILKTMKNESTFGEKFIIIDKKNEGTGKTLQLGLQKATGEYIYFIDHDDLLDLDLIEKMVKKAKTFNSDMVLTQSKVIMLDDGLLNRPPNYYYFKSLDANHSYDKESFLISTKLRAPLWLWLVKTSVMKQNNIYFDTLDNWDEPIVPKIIHFSNHFSFVEDSFYYHRIRSGSIVTSQNTDKVFISYKTAINIINDFKNKHIGNIGQNEVRYLNQKINGLLFMLYSNPDITNKSVEEIFRQNSLKFSMKKKIHWRIRRKLICIRDLIR